MVSFILAVAALIAGYFVYGSIAEKIFGADSSRITPAHRMNDGIDFVPMSWWRVFLIQFLNIAGLGPIFGAIAGAMYGPVAFLWIVLGTLFAGAVHDYFSGMISLRENGLSIPETVGKYLGKGMKFFMRGMTILLLLLVGTVFILGPAKIMNGLTGDYFSVTQWVWVIFIYYIMATVLPIDKLIGRIYPVFGAALLFMAFGITFGLIFEGYKIPELIPSNLYNMNGDPGQFPIIPMLFITIACGAFSGFHATQTPLMARCITNEKYGRRVFYGAMVTEGIVALIWAAAGMSFFGGVPQLNQVMAEQQGNAAWIVNIISTTLLGKIGGAIAVLGVVAAPITTGDTAFRSARLIISDFLLVKQEKFRNRLLISAPIFIAGLFLTRVNFAVVWRYFAWTNQALGTIVLWTISAYLASERKNYWISFLPAVFMTFVCSSYIFIAPEGVRLGQMPGYILGFSITAAVSALFFYSMKRRPDPAVSDGML